MRADSANGCLLSLLIPPRRGALFGQGGALRRRQLPHARFATLGAAFLAALASHLPHHSGDCIFFHFNMLEAFLAKVNRFLLYARSASGNLVPVHARSGTGTNSLFTEEKRMPKTPMTKPAAKLKLELDPTGCTMQRREAIRKNREPVEKERLEQAIAEYGEVMRRLFKQGYVSYYYISNDTRRHERGAKDFRTTERMEAFEAQRAAERNAMRKGGRRAYGAA